MRVAYADIPAELKRSSAAWGVWQVARIWAVIAACFWVANRIAMPGAWLICVPIVGLMQYHLSVLGHHSLHGNITRSAALSDWLGTYLVHGALGLPQRAMWRNHMLHHAQFEGERDPERAHYMLELHGRQSRNGLRLWWITRFCGAEAVMAAGRVLSGAIEPRAGRATETSSILGDWLPVLCTQSVIALGSWLLSGWPWAYLAVWILPQVTVLTGLMATRTMLEHADTGSPPQRLLSFACGPVERVLLGPLGFNWHAEHHLYPTIPAEHLSALHGFLQQRRALGPIRVMPSYRARFRDLLHSLPQTAPISGVAGGDSQV